MAFQKIN